MNTMLQKIKQRFSASAQRASVPAPTPTNDTPASAAERLSTVLQTFPLQPSAILNATKALQTAVQHSLLMPSSSSNTLHPRTVLRSIVASWAHLRKLQLGTTTTTTSNKRKPPRRRPTLSDNTTSYLQHAETVLIQVLTTLASSSDHTNTSTSTVRAILNNAICMETMVLHINRVLLLVMQDQDQQDPQDPQDQQMDFQAKSGRHRVLGLCCLSLVAWMGGVKKKRMTHLLTSHLLLEKFIALMALLEGTTMEPAEENKEQDKARANDDHEEEHCNASNAEVCRACIQVLVVLKTSGTPHAPATLIPHVPKRTTMSTRK